MLLYPLLPDRVPVHYSWGWRPSGTGSKAELLESAVEIMAVGAAVDVLLYFFAMVSPEVPLMALPLSLGLGMLALSTVVLGLCTPPG
ncbi:hypothetical protein PABY_05510 [Pyrodictium abyssi]|uniref:DUF1648 domain-containing protein n=1 Tax=Pyrodictium abyssi TaxID=54256 RepID=A0ABM8ITU6_9CREN|nr:hypothetical protein PABY_05510 [Pyrodictium abyssi]